MTFHPVIACGSSASAADVALFALVFAVPAILLALRTCLPEESRVGRFVRMAFPVASAGSILVIGVWIDLLDALAAFAIAYAGLSAGAAALGVRVYRRLDHARRVEAPADAVERERYLRSA
jgi:hypothetical protein